jgi:hypothetical protein
LKSIFDNVTLLYARTIEWQMEIGTHTSWAAQTVKFFLPVSLCPLSSHFSFLESSWSGLNYNH